MVQPDIDGIDNENRDLFDPGQVLSALRDSRYQSTAYAIAELIDNSIEAESRHIDLLCREVESTANVRRRTRVDAVGVADNGCGMDPPVLIRALRFGGRGNLISQRRNRIGKYGVGLPASSVSQCKRADVWTWQNGINSAWHSYLDVEEINTGNQQIPQPDQLPVPAEWIAEMRPNIRESESGTLVIWNDLDRIDYRTANTIMDHVEKEAGRIFRHFIDDKRTSILMKPFCAGFQLQMESIDGSRAREIRPNDPLYLMRNSSTPAPWSEEPMFQRWGNPDYHKVQVNGKPETVEVHYSVVADQGLTPGVFRPGNEEHGQHAGRNTGISVLREDRELALLLPMVETGNEMNRWWGCEVRFNSGSDDLFGVDHNKQMVSRFALAVQRFAREAPTKDTQAVIDEFAGEDEELGQLYQLVGDIRNKTRSLLGDVKQRFSERRASQSRNNTSNTVVQQAENIASEIDREEEEQGIRTETEGDRIRKETPPEERILRLEQLLVETGGYELEEAHIEGERIVDQDVRYKFLPRKLDGSSMFSVRNEEGVLLIQLNLEHPTYDLLKLLEETVDPGETEVVEACLAMRLLVCSWARMEDNLHDRSEKRQVQDIAGRWGRQAEVIFDSMVERLGLNQVKGE